MVRAIILLTCILAFLGCSEKKKPESSADALGPDSMNEEWFNESIGGLMERENVRKAVSEFFPSAKCVVEGLSTSEVNGNLFLVAADLECDKRRATIDLVVRRFYPLGKGQPYWKTARLTPDLAQALGVYARTNTAAVNER